MRQKADKEGWRRKWRDKGDIEKGKRKPCRGLIEQSSKLQNFNKYCKADSRFFLLPETL
jgi:hypothetical protein